ncbi:MAG: alpha-galactosidase [Planctomycetes bacterium]|nr:alpha-galactosidase [Planctomycetota bacterium]
MDHAVTRCARSVFAVFVGTLVVARSQSAPTSLAMNDRPDWLASNARWPARIDTVEGARALVISNGLVSRRIDLELGGSTTALDDIRTSASHVRAVCPAARLRIDGHELRCGGVIARRDGASLDRAFLPAIAELAVDPEALVLTAVELGTPRERVPWKRTRHASNFAVCPPRGVRVTLTFAARDGDRDVPAGLRIDVDYELYDDVPVFGKRVRVRNTGAASIVVDRMTTEELAVVPDSSWVETRDGVPLPAPARLHVESEYAMGGMSPANANRFGVRWLPDPAFETQVNYLRKTPCLLEVGPDQDMLRTLEPGASLTAPMAFTTVLDSEDRTRRSLTMARAYEVLAPWSTENPLMMHVRHADDATVESAIEQARDVGFELVLLTFGSGFDIEDRSSENLKRWKRLAGRAHDRGIQLGGYTLLSSRKLAREEDLCVHPETGKPGGQTHGYCPALASPWGLAYFETLRHFVESTGFDAIEHDGPYPGDLDASSRPPLQHGVSDSRFVQWTLSADFYRWCRSRGVYVNAPDWYFLVGASKTGMGYRETNWSLERSRQVLHARQNIYDGTILKRPSMGWMFVPLTEYHGGGAAATVEPLSEHLDHYAAMLAANLGAGVQACYRGPRLYDTPKTRELVRGYVQWFLEYRDVLRAPIVHEASRRADGRDIDWLLHAEPRSTSTQAMLCVYRPGQVGAAIVRRVVVDLRYAGFAPGEIVEVRSPLGEPRRLEVDARRRVTLQIEIAQGEPMTWVAFRRPG